MSSITVESTNVSGFNGFCLSKNGRTEKNYTALIDEVIQKGIAYLETTYTLADGLIPEISLGENINPIAARNTAVILDILSESGVPLSPDNTERAITWQQEDVKQTLNFSNSLGQKSYKVQLQDGLIKISCLHGLNGISKEEANNLIEDMLSQADSFEDGFPTDMNLTGDCSYVWPEWKNYKQVDIGLLGNILYCLGRMDSIDVLNSPKLDACFNVINCVLNDMLTGTKNESFRNYENIDLTLFLVSRAVQYSEKAKILFGNKVEILVRDRIGIDKVALNLACRILTAVNLGIGEMYEEAILREVKLLIKLRNLEDNSWSTFEGNSNLKRKDTVGSNVGTTGLALAALQKVRNVLPRYTLFMM